MAPTGKSLSAEIINILATAACLAVVAVRCARRSILDGEPKVITAASRLRTTMARDSKIRRCFGRAVRGGCALLVLTAHLSTFHPSLPRFIAWPAASTKPRRGTLSRGLLARLASGLHSPRSTRALPGVLAPAARGATTVRRGKLPTIVTSSRSIVVTHIGTARIIQRKRPDHALPASSSSALDVASAWDTMAQTL